MRARVIEGYIHEESRQVPVRYVPSFFRAALTCAILGSGFLTGVSSAAAQERVAVLTLGSPVADETFATTFSGTLRYAASRVQGWRVSDVDVSVDQVVMALGCEEPTDSCWAAAAAELEADIVIHGQIRRAGGSYRVDVSLFRVSTGESISSIEDEIPVRRSDIDDLRPRIAGYMQQLSGDRPSVVVIMTNVPGATVEIGGESIGRTDATGRLRVESLAPGQHEISIQADDHQQYNGQFQLSAGDTVDFEANLLPTDSPDDVLGDAATDEPSEPSAPRDWRRIAGWSLVAAGAVSGALGINANIATYRLWSQEQDSGSQYNSYRADLGANGRVCDGSFNSGNSAGTAESQWREWCDALDQQVWQVVFYAVGGAALGAGIYLLLTDADEDADEPPMELTLHPNLSPEGGSLTARIRY